jgi:peptidoglycan/LPS O-acetylase OafA/YrhL
MLPLTFGAGATHPDRAAHGIRADIQGMRAIAVLMVIAFHAQLTGFGGGYIGVDVFFVISGYLITGLLQRELACTGRIDLLRFWGRRVRRLMPNACVVLLATLTLAMVVQPAHVYGKIAGGVAAAALYAANYYFAANTVDYFAEDDAPSPVLHFWSLSVEEQFYIVWPLLLAALVFASRDRHRRSALMARAGWLLAAIWIVSLIASLVTIRHNQPMAFYHTEMRAWQLATGGLLALGEARLVLIPVLALGRLAGDRGQRRLL